MVTCINPDFVTCDDDDNDEYTSSESLVADALPDTINLPALNVNDGDSNPDNTSITLSPSKQKGGLKKNKKNQSKESETKIIKYDSQRC